MLRKCSYTERRHRWYASKEYNYEIRFDIMISFTKLRTVRQSSFSITIVTQAKRWQNGSYVMGTTDKQGTNRSHKSAKKEKMINITNLARKLHATAEIMHAGLDTFGAKLPSINLTSNKRKKVTDWI